MQRHWKLAVLLAMAISVALSSGAQGRQPPKAARILYTRFDALYVTDVSGSQGRLLVKGVWAAALSPDGDLVAYADEKAIRVLSLANPSSNVGYDGSRSFGGLPCHSVTIARTQVRTGFMTSAGMRRVA